MQQDYFCSHFASRVLGFWGSLASMVSYVGVSRPSGMLRDRGWVAQHRQKKIWKGGFASSLAAARWLAARLRVPVDKLRRRKRSGVQADPNALPMSRYHGVVCRVRQSGGVLYEVRVPGQLPKTFTEEMSAAKFVSRYRRVALKKLKKPEPFTRALAKKLWGCVFRVFKLYQPGDLVHLVKMTKECQSWFTQEPTLLMICVMLKYGPWREAFITSWRSLLSSGVPVCPSSLRQRASMLLRALQGMCKKMDAVDDELWRTSLGRNISHVNGPLATLHTFGVVFRCSGGLRLGLQSKRVCRGLLETTRAVKRLSKWVRLADDCVVQAPRTCEAWVAEHSKLDMAFQRHGVYRPLSYNRNFAIRGLLLSAMGAEDIEALQGASDITVRDFAQAFPDQRAWLRRLPRWPGMTLQDLFDDLGYDGRPECFSMYTCLLLTRGMRKTPQWYQKHGRRLTELMLDQGRAQGVMRLPLVCVDDLRKA